MTVPTWDERKAHKMVEHDNDIDLEENAERSGQDRNWKQMREKADKLETEVVELRAKLRKSAFKEAGFDPDIGQGKALAKLYDGDADADSVRKFAKAEFGWEPDVRDALSPQAEQVARSQARLDRIGSISSSVPPAPDQLEALLTDADNLEGQGQFAAALTKRLQAQRMTAGQ